ncbi:MAG: hypothetical protein N3A65_00840 [candidate division WOR-3 bacterium]|nr:hypothetical protein [candidate division WOR-3 bacterium]
MHKIKRLFLLLIFISTIGFLSCAPVFKSPSPLIRGDMMFVDEDKDVDLIRAEETVTEGGSHSGCPT